MVYFALSLVLSAVSFSAASMAADIPTLKRTVVTSGLEKPWDMVELPGGSILYTELCKGLSVLSPDGNTVRLFGTVGSSLVADDFHCEGQSGMNGVTLDPDFHDNRLLYVFMASKAADGAVTNHVVRMVLAEDNGTVAYRSDIVEDIPFKEKANAHGKAGSHSGGRLRFGPDGSLYVTTGDNHNGTLPQDLQSLGGKVLRLTRDGKPAQGNSTPDAGDKRIFTFGHRNPQGLAFHPTTGQAYTAEHGPRHTDEVTALVAGRNGGWDPKPEPGVKCDDDYCGYGSNKLDGTPTPMSDSGKFQNVMAPLWTNNGKSEGMGPAEFLSGPQWKKWNGSLMVGMMGNHRTDVLNLNEDGSLNSVDRADLPQQRVRSLRQTAQGNLLILTDEGELWKVVPQ
jgi:aldose sugar dehydrogenase